MTIVHMKPVKSSSVSRVGYDATTQTLAIHFSGSQKTYHYADVPQSVVDDMHRAESIGKFVGAHIKGKFSHQAHEMA
jgi:hypothetical protein